MSVDWSDLKQGFAPGEPWASFYVIRGKPGVGKSTLAYGIPDSVVADMDPAEGGKYVVGARAKRKRITTWAELQEFKAKLKADAGPNATFKVVILDPAGQLLTLCRHRIKEKLKVEDIEGFDHGKVNSLFREQYLDLINWGYYPVIIDHEVDIRMLQKGGSEKIVTEALLPGGITKYLDQDCHHTLTMTLTPSVVSVKDAKTGRERAATHLTFGITTKPGRRTSLVNPKTRIWLPEELKDIPQTGDASVVWDHFAAECHKAIAKMTSNGTKNVA